MKRSEIMLCYPFEEKRLEKWKPPFIIQPKLDGIRCRAKYEHGGWSLFSSEMNSINSVPHIIRDLNENIDPSFHELDGELYVHGMDFSEIFSITGRTQNIHLEHEIMQFHIFDLADEHSAQYQRLSSLMALKETKNILKVPNQIAYNLSEIMEIYQEFLSHNYEGIIVRNIDNLYVRKRSTHLMKFKPKKSDTYRIIGFKEEISIHGDPKNSLGAFVCIGDDGTKFSVGSGLTSGQRQIYWQNKDSLVGKLCRIEYQHISPSGRVPRFPVFVEVLESPNLKNPLLDWR